MLTIRRSEDRGHADHGWLDTRHTFSFAGYHDPGFMGFSLLRVLNQDVVAPGKGFGTHPHRDMEIVSWVLEGALEHRDSMGNGSVIRPGEAQLMSAGSGVTHSEFNASPDEPVHFLQMWILPARRGGLPRYEQKAFAAEARRDRLVLLVSPDGRQGSLTIGQDVRLHAGLLSPGARVRHQLAPGRCAWLHVPRGALTVDDQRLGPGDGAAVQGATELLLQGGADGPSEVVLWDLPEQAPAG